MLHKPSRERIADGTISGEHVARLFEDMAMEAHEMGMEGSHICIPYVEEDDDFLPGTYVPEIHLVLRRIEDESQDTEDS